MAITRSLSSDKKILTLSIQGPFDFSEVYDFRASYTELENKPEKVILDFRHTLHLDSSALGMLLNLKRYINAGDGEIDITNVRADLKKILHIAHFEKLFNIT